MSLEGDAVRVLVCRFLAHQALPRTDELVRRLLLDAPFREAVDAALGQVGLELAENVYADFVSVRVARDLETPVFEDGQGSYWSNNVGLSPGAMALLTILWSLLILPKRQRQQEQTAFTPHPDPLPIQTPSPLMGEGSGGGEGGDLLPPHPNLPPRGGEGDLPTSGTSRREGMGGVEIAIERKALEADFGHLFSNQIRFHGYLNELKRRGFIHEQRGKFTEGPLLDVLVDYSTLAPRILEGALSRVLAARFDQASPMEPQIDTDEHGLNK
ncbi:MAG: hypothetical protein HYZ81_10455 [Nitrospinae bacterium]|nr:hypothetical protein [Nitrospinota bacterium]